LVSSRTTVAEEKGEHEPGFSMGRKMRSHAGEDLEEILGLCVGHGGKISGCIDVEREVERETHSSRG
jgi:hypothetical protein